MKVLVTGATGFVGSNLVKRLQKEGWQLSLLIRPEGDLSNMKSLKKAVGNVDIVFHLAAALPHHLLKDREYWETNVQGTKNLLDACKGRKIKRFVHVSTVGIYGAVTAYSKSKKEAEKVVMSYYKKYKIPVTIIRPTIAYGPRDTRPGFLNLFRLINKNFFIPIGKGSNFFHTIYIDNLVDALYESAINKNAIGEDFIIGDEPCPKMSQIIKVMYKILKKKVPMFYIPVFVASCAGLFFDFAKKMGLPSFLPSQRVKFLTEDKRFDITKAKKILGWKPKISINEGLKRTFLWYKQEGLL